MPTYTANSQIPFPSVSFLLHCSVCWP